MERKMFPVAVHLFLLDKENILLLKRYNTGYEDGNYSVIAGHLDGNEDVYNAMIREAKEEAGVNISLENLQVVQVMHRKKTNEERIDYFFICEKWEGNIINKEPNKCSQLKWYSINNLPDNTVGYVKYAINSYQKNIKFTVYGW